jgi:hypothetical protein
VNATLGFSRRSFLPILYMSTAARHARILCVVPTRWPLPERAEAVARTWLSACDKVVLSVSRTELNASMPHYGNARARATCALNARVCQIRLPSGALVAATHTAHSVQPFHTNHGYSTRPWDIWNVVRSALSFVGSEAFISQTEWILMAEDDVYVSVPRLRHFLQKHSALGPPRFFGSCMCRRSPGINLFSREALRRMHAVLRDCEPDHTFNDPWTGFHDTGGASDKSITACLGRANLSCTTPTDSQQHLLLSVYSEYNRFEASNGSATNGWRMLLSNVTSRRPAFCMPMCDALIHRRQTHCVSPDAFAFHTIKDAAMIGEFHAALGGGHRPPHPND